ncbi:MAG: hypothetical protein M3552_15500 [Planctomycetota bacterium]|nr:hypothetical protein [Planctomycetota bacterium]
MSRQERLEEVYRRLTAAPALTSADEAFELICRSLEEVEDELSGIVKADPPPAPEQDDGRMYPPLGDYVRRMSNGGIIARSRRHRIVIGSNGRMKVWNLDTNDVEFER